MTINLYFVKDKNGGGGTCLIQGLMCDVWTKHEVEALVKLVSDMTSEEDQQCDQTPSLHLAPPAPNTVANVAPGNGDGVSVAVASGEDVTAPSTTDAAVAVVSGDGVTAPSTTETAAVVVVSGDGVTAPSTTEAAVAVASGDGVTAPSTTETAAGDRETVTIIEAANAVTSGDGETSTPTATLSQTPTSPVGTQTINNACQTCNGLSGVVTCGSCLLETVNNYKVQLDRRITILVQTHKDETAGLRVEIDRLTAELKRYKSKCDSIDGKCQELMKRTKPRAEERSRSAPSVAVASGDGATAPSTTEAAVTVASGDGATGPYTTKAAVAIAAGDGVTTPSTTEAAAAAIASGDGETESSTTGDQQHKEKRTSKTAPPLQSKPPSLRIPPKTTHVLIGDSNLQKVNKWGLDQSGCTFVKTFRGLTIENSINILGSTKVYKHIQNVTVHVGTNDLSNGCTDDEICQDMEILIDRLKYNFPDAKICISGILPQKKKRLSNIVKLNEKLLAVCERSGALLIYSKQQFLAKEKFPSHLFSTNKYHLNDTGVRVLIRGFINAFNTIQASGADVPSIDQFPTLQDSNPQGDRLSIMSQVSSRRDGGQSADDQAKREGQRPTNGSVQPRATIPRHGGISAAPHAPSQAAESQSPFPPHSVAPPNCPPHHPYPSVPRPVEPSGSSCINYRSADMAPPVGPQSAAEQVSPMIYGHPMNTFSRQASLPATMRNTLPIQHPFSHFQWPYQGFFPSPFYMSPSPYSLHGPPFIGN